MDYKKCTKFIAILDDDSEGFYIADVDSWNDEHWIPDIDYCYAYEVYKDIEKLGHDCWHDSENHFSVDIEFNDVQHLGKFLKPLKWIVAIDDQKYYVDPKTIAERPNVSELEDDTTPIDW